MTIYHTGYSNVGKCICAKNNLLALNIEMRNVIITSPTGDRSVPKICTSWEMFSHSIEG